MKFRRIRNVRVSYEKQGQIFFTLANYKNQPQTVRRIIDDLLLWAAGGDENYSGALRMWLIEGYPLQRAADAMHVRAPTMVGMRKKFYEAW